jgi:N-carbamoylputrescine amidase
MDNTSGSHKVVVAAVQMNCEFGRVAQNLERATHMVEQATKRGAQLVLLPELMPSGYQLTEKIWDFAEPMNGRTVGWMQLLAHRLDIYLGTTFLEAENEDFYNTFVLVTPTGDIAGRVRKSPPASLEAHFYRAGSGSHTIDTALGRLGVGICYENLLFARLNELYLAGVDLVLQPAATGRISPIIPGDLQRFDNTIRQIAPYYAKTLGVPVVMANRTGPFHTKLPGEDAELHSSFPGLSTIACAGGSIAATMGEEEGVAVAKVHLDPYCKSQHPPQPNGMWALPVPWYAFIWPLTQRLGQRAYAQNEHRRARARAILGGPIIAPP